MRRPSDHPPPERPRPSQRLGPQLLSGLQRQADARVAELLTCARRHLRVGTPAAVSSATTRSHLADGRCVGWYGPAVQGWTVAVDAEQANAPVPEFLGRRLGTAHFWSRWTRSECLCKLAHVPMHSWWRRHGLDVPAGFTGMWRTLRLADLIVTVAAAPAPPRP